MEFRLIIGFLEHLQIITTSNYRDVANSHTQQFVKTRTMIFQSAVSSSVVVWQRLPKP
jgi:hypothetical protein